MSKIPVISERFCGVKYQDNATNTSIVAYSAYLPTSGLDDEFLETLAQLSYDLQNNVNEKSSILIGLDSNQSEKSSRRRTKAMEQFSAHFSLKTLLIGDHNTHWP